MPACEEVENVQKTKEPEKDKCQTEAYKSEHEEKKACCAKTCVCKQHMRKKQGPLRTSDVQLTENIPKRFDNPQWFTGYGSQQKPELQQHPFFVTSSSDYGYFPPEACTMPYKFLPKSSKYTSFLSKSGMYRNYSLNTKLGIDPNTTYGKACG